MSLGNCCQSLEIPRIGVDAIVWTDRTFSDSQIAIKHQFWVNFEPCSQARTNWTRTLWRIKTKQPWLKLRNLFLGMFRTSIALRKRFDLIGISVKHLHHALPELQRLFADLDALTN